MDAARRIEMSGAEPSGEVFEEIGVVVSGAGGLEVETEHGRFPAKRAFSCLVAPELGDVVLVAVPGRGALFVLAVLERPSELPARLTSSGDLRVHLPSGRFTVSAQEGVALRTPGELDLEAKDVSLRAEVGAIVVKRLTYLGEVLEAHGGTLKAALRIVDSVTERWTQKTKRSYRFIEEMDITRAQEIDTRASGTLSMRGKNAITTAEELVKMDGRQIHLG
jgi:hypothetical protein